MFFNGQITEIAVDEYAFLTENFEFANKDEIKNGVGYIVFNRKRNILNTAKKIIENELNSLEKELVLDFWGKELKVEDLAQKYELSRAAIYRNLNSAKKKIEKYLKYVLIYEDDVQRYSVSDFIEFIKGDLH
ncbi:MAG: sigma-70 family RNA polymerase sigma factor [Clostridia bacterium]|nr:sigma-70 family RNA polymerase sigma factor [Clostridia bacterium]